MQLIYIVVQLPARYSRTGNGCIAQRYDLLYVLVPDPEEGNNKDRQMPAGVAQPGNGLHQDLLILFCP